METKGGIFMETMKAIQERRSVRSYHPRQIPDEVLKEILEAALMAPTAMNRQAWHFTVIQDASFLDRLVEINAKGCVNAGLEPPEEGTHNFYHAPTAVLLSYETADENAGLNCGAAVENMLLAARSFGVASVFLGSLGFLFTTEEAEELKKQCGIPENYSYCCAVALGYPSGEWPEAPERNREVFTFIK